MLAGEQHGLETVHCTRSDDKHEEKKLTVRMQVLDRNLRDQRVGGAGRGGTIELK